MSADAIADLTSAIRNRIEAAVGASTVHIGPPVSADLTAGESITLFLFHVEPNRELRNVDHLVDPPGGGPDDLLAVSEGLPLDLRYVISVFRRPPNAADPVELRVLGQLVQALAAEPDLHRPGAARPDGAAHARALPDGGDEPGVGPVSRRRRTRRRSCTWPPR